MRRDRKKERSGNGSERGGYPSAYYRPTMTQPFGYDPYSSYYQHQQYYENLRRTNPIAYAEWYNRYIASQLATTTSVQATVASDRGRESGRESVHSGRYLIYLEEFTPYLQISEIHNMNSIYRIFNHIFFVIFPLGRSSSKDNDR